MILHLLSDEKFTDYVINIFEKVSQNKNHYLVSNDTSELKYVKTTSENLIVTGRDSIIYQNIIKNIYEYKAIIIHNLYDEYKKDLLKKLPPGIHVHWMCWGVDLYFIPQLSSRLIGNMTRKAVSKHKIPLIYYQLQSLVKKYLPDLWDNIALIKGNRKGYNDYRYLLKNINSYSTVVPSESKIIEKYLIRKPIIPFKYAILKNDLTVNGGVCIENNFLIGNSATITNNHFDVFHVLKKMNIEYFKIITPLSYGDLNYAKLVAKTGKSLFGDNFIPLFEFLTKEEFSKLLNQCGNVVMNHHRQQGLGTILISLWKGARIFINPINPIYEFFRINDIQVFSIKELPKWKCLPDCKELADSNRPKLKKLYGEKIVLQEVSELVNYLNK